MSYVRNAWYVAAWDHEIGREMLRRIILDEPVMLYRREDGKPVALEDRCCHRQAPLSMGKLIGDIVKCPYHGLEFDSSGACVRVPSQERVPPSARVKAYPVVERNHWIWIWTGDPAQADPSLIEDFHWMDDPKWGFGGNYLHVDANYLLLVENLLDTTHLPFLHPTSLGTDAFAKSEFEVTREGDRIKVARWLMDKPPAPFHKQMGGFPDGMNVDRWQIAHFFYAQAYNFKLDQRWVSDLVRSQVTKAFLEDMAMIKAQQQNMDLGPSQAVSLGQDKAWIAMRQIVQRLIQEEQQAARAVAA
jgi:phenylpropionate dioxygenase-like ring-hydroxylating dioxygenase large terminal subunit